MPTRATKPQRKLESIKKATTATISSFGAEMDAIQSLTALTKACLTSANMPMAIHRLHQLAGIATNTARQLEWYIARIEGASEMVTNKERRKAGVSTQEKAVRELSQHKRQATLAQRRNVQAI